jgi:hypothetical protein
MLCKILLHTHPFFRFLAVDIITSFYKNRKMAVAALLTTSAAASDLRPLIFCAARREETVLLREYRMGRCSIRRRADSFSFSFFLFANLTSGGV